MKKNESPKESSSASDEQPKLKIERQIWHLPKPWVLEELYSRRWIAMAMWVICVALCFFLIWAFFAQVNETAIAMGELEPIGGLSIVDHAEGGTVSAVFVKEGEAVKAGTPLVQLNEAAVKAELERLKAKASNFLEDSRRLTAFIQNTEVQQSIDPATVVSTAGVLDDQVFLLLQEQSKADQLGVAKAEMAKKEKDIDKLKDQRDLTRKQLDLAKQEEAMYVSLVDQGVVSKRDYLRVQGARMELEKDVVGLETQYQQAQDDLLAAKANYARIISMLKESAAKDLNIIQRELAETNQSIPRLEDSLNRMTIRAPIDGVVKGLDVSIGKVIPPNGTVLTLVPQNRGLEVVARVQPQDVGFVAVGDPAMVKVSAYDFSRYGFISGVIKDISASTYKDEKDQPYYKVWVTLKTQYVEHQDYTLQSGMTVQVDIVTGSKSILQYLLKPIHLTFKNAFHER